MKVLVDSSVWGDFFNGYPSHEAEALGELIKGEDDICTCGVVVAEVFQGLKKDSSRTELEALFRELTFLEAAGFGPYFKSAALYRELRKKGKTVRSTIDCLIAVLASENGCYLLAKDRDLRVIAQSGVLELSLWPL